MSRSRAVYRRRSRPSINDERRAQPKPSAPDREGRGGGNELRRMQHAAPVQGIAGQDQHEDAGGRDDADPHPPLGWNALTAQSVRLAGGHQSLYLQRQPNMQRDRGSSGDCSAGSDNLCSSVRLHRCGWLCRLLLFCAEGLVLLRPCVIRDRFFRLRCNCQGRLRHAQVAFGTANTAASKFVIHRLLGSSRHRRIMNSISRCGARIGKIQCVGLHAYCGRVTYLAGPSA
jgi:hypothetical protein